MQTLIRHELRTSAVHFIIPLLLGIIVSIACAVSFLDIEYDLPPLGIPVIFFQFTWVVIFFPLAAMILGISQMSGDRKNKLSSYLCTLATTRQEILTARLGVGLFWNFLVLLPIFTWFILLAIFPQLLPVDWFFLVQIAILVFLLNAACYSLGLLFGGFEGRFIQIAALLPFFFVLFITIIRGMSWECYGFLLAVTLSAILLVVQKFLKMPL